MQYPCIFPPHGTTSCYKHVSHTRLPPAGGLGHLLPLAAAAPRRLRRGYIGSGATYSRVAQTRRGVQIRLRQAQAPPIPTPSLGYYGTFLTQIPACAGPTPVASVFLASPDSHKPVPGETKTRFPRSTGVRCSRARCSLVEQSNCVPVFFYRLERACTAPTSTGPHPSFPPSPQQYRISSSLRLGHATQPPGRVFRSCV
jgi:hypothetical protein